MEDSPLEKAMEDPHRDARGVPVSRGIPLAVRVAAAVGILLIFWIGWITIHDSGYGHLWPSSQTLKLKT